MRVNNPFAISRRDFLKTATTTAVALSLPNLLTACNQTSSTNPIKIGVLLSYSDIYAVLGQNITKGMELYFNSLGNQIAGRPIQLIKEDDELKPDVAQQKIRKLVEQDQVDFVTGIISSAVLAALRDYLVENKKLLICSNAGANELSRANKTPYIWRTSFTNWMPPYTMGSWAATNIGKRAIISVPDYAAGENNVTSFTHSFQEAGGTVVGVQRTPFPNMGDAAPFMAELANANADLVYAFYSGSAAVTFVKAYQQFGLSGQLPLTGSGFLVEEDVLPAQGDSALGVKNSLYWSYMLENAQNQQFKQDFYQFAGHDADVFAVQGYDTAKVIEQMLLRTEGDTAVDKLIAALDGVSFDSPRGPFSLDAHSQAPRHHMYLRDLQRVDGHLRNVILADLGPIADPGDDSKG